MRRVVFATLCLCSTQVTAERWPERKCAIFAEAWDTSAPDAGLHAPGREFRRKIEAFIASGCEAPRDACPATAADLVLADALAMIVAVEGMSTTFLPIACPEL